MEIILYRHAEPVITEKEIISGADFRKWVQHYNRTGIKRGAIRQTEQVACASDMPRNYETAALLAQTVKQEKLFREAELPLLSSPPFALQQVLGYFSPESSGCWALQQIVNPGRQPNNELTS